MGVCGRVGLQVRMGMCGRVDLQMQGRAEADDCGREHVDAIPADMLACGCG